MNAWCTWHRLVSAAPSLRGAPDVRERRINWPESRRRMTKKYGRLEPCRKHLPLTDSRLDFEDRQTMCDIPRRFQRLSNCTVIVLHDTCGKQINELLLKINRNGKRKKKLELTEELIYTRKLIDLRAVGKLNQLVQLFIRFFFFYEFDVDFPVLHLFILLFSYYSLRRFI